eukprot:365211-Chlamydomonas_euryale.AAC.6
MHPHQSTNTSKPCCRPGPTPNVRPTHPATNAHHPSLQLHMRKGPPSHTPRAPHTCSCTCARALLHTHTHHTHTPHSHAQVRKEWSHPVSGCFFALPLVTLVLLALVVSPYSLTLAKVAFWAAAPLSLALSMLKVGGRQVGVWGGGASGVEHGCGWEEGAGGKGSRDLWAVAPLSLASGIFNVCGGEGGGGAGQLGKGSVHCFEHTHTQQPPTAPPVEAPATFQLPGGHGVEVVSTLKYVGSVVQQDCTQRAPSTAGSAVPTSPSASFGPSSGPAAGLRRAQSASSTMPTACQP